MRNLPKAMKQDREYYKNKQVLKKAERAFMRDAIKSAGKNILSEMTKRMQARMDEVKQSTDSLDALALTSAAAGMSMARLAGAAGRIRMPDIIVSSRIPKYRVYVNDTLIGEGFENIVDRIFGRSNDEDEFERAERTGERPQHIMDFRDMAREHARNNPMGHFWKRDASGDIDMGNRIRISHSLFGKILHEGPICESCGYTYCPACHLDPEVQCGKGFIEGVCTQPLKELSYATTEATSATTTEGHSLEAVDHRDQGDSANAVVDVLQQERQPLDHQGVDPIGRLRFLFDDTRNLT